jgi:hypothetical protein
MPKTQVSSFVLRFVQEQPRTSWYGLVRHVQSNEELRFSRMEDVLDFLARYVVVENIDWAPPAATAAENLADDVQPP